MNPAFASTLLAQFKKVLSEIQQEMQNQNLCVLSCSLKAPLKHEQVVCFLLRSKEKEVDLLSEADYLTAEEADVLSEADFEEIEALFPLPEVVMPEVLMPEVLMPDVIVPNVVHKHCVSWLVPEVVVPEVVHKHCEAWLALPPDVVAPEVVHKHCIAWVPPDAKLSDDAELSDNDAELSDNAKLSDSDDDLYN